MATWRLERNAELIRRVASGEERPCIDYNYFEMTEIAHENWDDVFTLFAVLAESYERVGRNPGSKAQQVVDEVQPRLREILRKLPEEPDPVLGNGSLDPRTWPDVGLLRHLGYSVGANGLSPSARHKILDRVFGGPIPLVVSPAYMAQWGSDGSYTRLYKLAWSLAAFASARIRKNEGRRDQATLAWIADLSWLKESFYHEHFGLPWPEIP